MKAEVKNASKKWFVVAFEEEFQSDTCNVIYTGAGKVNAAMATQWLIDHYEVEEIINVGTAGGNPNIVTKGLVYTIGTVVDRDFVTPTLVGVAFKTDNEFIYGAENCYTGDSFVTNLEDKEYGIVDMEACAIAAVCKENNVKFKCYKYISDTGSDADWKESLYKCNETFKRIFI